ncbi:MAG TPA: ATP-binding protein, partial [Longimicrobiaceae bacterium]|nr:ATP-binding protein [Longimicrobiaceae bacterium]
EIASFRQEAQVRRKELLTRFEAVSDGHYRVNGLVLRQALAILVDNAIRYAVPGPIRISACASGRELTVRVEDTGPGLSARRQSGSGGSGIGLELCRSLVRRAGGSLELERDSPDGTSFVLRLPAPPLSPT